MFFFVLILVISLMIYSVHLKYDLFVRYSFRALGQCVEVIDPSLANSSYISSSSESSSDNQHGGKR